METNLDIEPGERPELGREVRAAVDLDGALVDSPEHTPTRRRCEQDVEGALVFDAAHRLPGRRLERRPLIEPAMRLALVDRLDPRIDPLLEIGRRELYPVDIRLTLATSRGEAPARPDRLALRHVVTREARQIGEASPLQRPEEALDERLHLGAVGRKDVVLDPEIGKHRRMCRLT